MAIEQYTESLTLQEMNCTIGEHELGYVLPQGDVGAVDKIELLLKQAGGKPKVCDLEDFTQGGKGKAKPEYVITFNDDINTIIVVECKRSTKYHRSEKCNQPNAYAVDGVLYYAKFLKKGYNVIAVAVSGTKKENMKVDTFYWLKDQDRFTALSKAKDIILEPLNYIKLIKGEKLQKQYSLEDIRETALEMHETLRQIKVTEKHKPIFIAGILIALENKEFSDEYSSCTTFASVIKKLNSAIDEVLTESDIKKDKIDYIKSAFRIIGSNEKLKAIPLGHKNSITWYIEQLEIKIKPMMNHADMTIDALGVFYHEFVKYSGGDGSGLGIVLTPQHLTEFMCDVANVNKNSKVVDICCGSGSFLVTAMSKMFRQANANEITKIKKEGLYGVELDPDLFTLAIANMIIRKDGKSNIYHGDCFNNSIKKDLKSKNLNIGLMNPPYSQEDICELEFTENLLDILVPGGTGVVVVPMSCAIGTKFKDVRERLFKKHSLKAVFSMPDDIFYPTGTNVCVMVWEAHTPHDLTQETFFGYYKDDGFEKRKKLGRVDANNKWLQIESEWLKLYRNHDIKDGLSARRCVKHTDEWLCEAYMKTDYSQLNQNDFQKTINEYLAYLIKSGDKHEG
ncbi:MAG: N-6 DNA methylase [Dysgonamonadaceae bacterium]|nr:N-6 DNA methylase [Dysgonamonadaceae bacterium]